MKTLLIIMAALMAAANNGGLVKEETHMVSLTGMKDEVKAIAEEHYETVEEEWGRDGHDVSVNGETFERDTIELEIDGSYYIVKYWYGPEMGLTYIYDDCDARCGRHPDEYHSHHWSDEKCTTMVEIDDYYWGTEDC